MALLKHKRVINITVSLIFVGCCIKENETTTPHHQEDFQKSINYSEILTDVWSLSTSRQITDSGQTIIGDYFVGPDFDFTQKGILYISYDSLTPNKEFVKVTMPPIYYSVYEDKFKVDSCSDPFLLDTVGVYRIKIDQSRPFSFSLTPEDMRKHKGLGFINMDIFNQFYGYNETPPE